MWSSFYFKHISTCVVQLCLLSFFSAVMSSLIPEKQMREWKEVLLSGLPLYESIKGQQPEFEFSTPLDPVELKKQEILNNQDYDEYTVSLKHECSILFHHVLSA